MSDNEILTEVITFRRDDTLATVVTDGERVRTYEPEICQAFASLHSAIAHFEAHGYEIYIESLTTCNL